MAEDPHYPRFDIRHVPFAPTGFSSSQMVERSTRHEGYGEDTRRWPGKDGRRRGNVFPVRQADRGWTGPGRGPIRAACPGAAGHQPLPGVRRLDVTVVRPAPPRPAAGARGPTHRTTGRHVASPSPSRPPSASPAPAVAEEAKEVDPQGRRDRLRVSHVHHSHACGISGLEVIITRLLSSGWRFPILRGAERSRRGWRPPTEKRCGMSSIQTSTSPALRQRTVPSLSIAA